VNAIRDALISLIFWLVLSGLCAALGLRILRVHAPKSITSGELYLFGLALGSGLLAYMVFGLGLIGWISTPAIAALIILLSIIAAPELSAMTRLVPTIPGRALSIWSTASPMLKVFASLAVVSAALALLIALSPPWDYDGLMYHLVGPSQILKYGSIVADHNNWYVNGPSAIEMLFLVALSFGDDTVPKLVHFLGGFVFLAGTYVMGRRWIDPEGAWIAVAILLGIPLIPILSSFAYIDLFWSGYEILAIGSALIWWRNGDRRWLVLCGTFAGFALGSKYLGLIGIGVVVAFVGSLSLRRGLRPAVEAIAIILVPAALVGMPWLIKNLVLLGNPFFPYLPPFSVIALDRLESFMEFLVSFGTGRDALDFLALPVNVYLRNELFGAVMNRIDIPSLLFPLAILYGFQKKNPVITALLLLAGARSLLWAFGSQQIRFLFPVYPELALVAAYSIRQVADDRRLSSAFRMFLPALAVGLIAIPIFYQLRVLINTGTVNTLTGVESKSEFLSRNVTGFSELSKLQLSTDSRVVLIGDGRGYYCLPDCIPDPDHFRWISEIAAHDSCKEFIVWMKSMQADYLLLNWEDLDFLSQHDPKGLIPAGLAKVSELEQNNCIQLHTETQSVTVFRARYADS
jgi:hypothetical protein